MMIFVVLFVVLVGVLLVARVRISGKPTNNGSTADELTAELFQEPQPPKDEIVRRTVDKLNNTPIYDNEEECAEAFRTFLSDASIFPYKLLVEDPVKLLRCNKHLTSSNGGFLTRFTVQFNLYAGSIVMLGSEEQRESLYEQQKSGTLGCFAFTEKGAGVMSGAAVETTAVYNPTDDTFTINSPTETSHKNWISQGLYAEFAVILARLEVKGKDLGPHLFFTRIANRKSGGGVESLPGVSVSSIGEKNSMRGLDNAIISFASFTVPRSSLLNRFSGVSASGDYTTQFPQGCKRNLDLLLSRLLTGRVSLSEAAVGYARHLLRRSWKYCMQRQLHGGPLGPLLLSELPLIQSSFINAARSLEVIANFCAVVREDLGKALKTDSISSDLVERVCMCKFLGTSTAVDVVSLVRKLLGSRALFQDSQLGDGSFLTYASCFAEGDNNIMELKVVGDVARKRVSFFPPCPLPTSFNMIYFTGRMLVQYLVDFTAAKIAGKKALQDSQLIKDIAWERTHLQVLRAWQREGGDNAAIPYYAYSMMQRSIPAVFTF